jgi:hypothetical protein
LLSQKKVKNVLEIVKKINGDEALKRTPILAVIKKGKEGKPAAADQRHLNAKLPSPLSLSK